MSLKPYSNNRFLDKSSRSAAAQRIARLSGRFGYSLFIPMLLSGVLLLFGSAHPVHTSVTQMQYNAAEKTFEISLRVFTDDFEEVLTKESNQKIRLTDKDNNNALVERYLRKHFVISNARRQPRAYRYLGKEQEADATWIYIEVPYNEPVQGSYLEQSMLMDTFDDQINLVNVSYLAQKKTFLFKKSSVVQELNW